MVRDAAHLQLSCTSELTLRREYTSLFLLVPLSSVQLTYVSLGTTNSREDPWNKLDAAPPIAFPSVSCVTPEQLAFLKVRHTRARMHKFKYSSVRYHCHNILAMAPFGASGPAPGPRGERN